nr:CPBP family intramembrane glutamic endopeptidase [uncultured Flavobacterium sp.]
MKNKINYPAILTFYVIAVLLRYLSNKTTLLDVVPNSFIRTVLSGIGPAMGAFVAFTVFKIKPVLSLKGNYKNVAIPFMLYWVLPVVLIPGVQYAVKGTASFVTVAVILVYGLMEEIGWRGFLQQQLKTLPLFLNVLIVATLWFAWHLNFELTSSNLFFYAILVLGSWGIGKVSDASQSLLAVSAFHSLNNFFPAMDTTKLLIIATLLTIWIVSLVIKKRQQKVITA